MAMTQLSKGIRVEQEHKDLYDYFKKHCTGECKMLSRNEFFGSIAKAHIKEDKKYYTKLRKAGL